MNESDCVWKSTISTNNDQFFIIKILWKSGTFTIKTEFRDVKLKKKKKWNEQILFQYSSY